MTMQRDDDDEQKIGQNKEMNKINQLIVNTKWNNYKQFFSFLLVKTAKIEYPPYTT